MRLKKSSLLLSIPLLALPSWADLFTNGDFEDAGTSWEEVAGGGTFSFSYPTTGGNDGSFGLIDHTTADGGFGIWVGNDGQPFTLTSLGLTAGSTYDFTHDMKILSGPNIGGFKLDFTDGGNGAGSTGDLRPALIGDGTTWETYRFRIKIPAGVDGFKVVPLWGVDSSVGFDNLGFSVTPILPPVVPPPALGSFEPRYTDGTFVNWTPTNSDKFHQPQSSQDGTTWTDFGTAYPGIETTSVLDPNSAPFYRIQEKDPAGAESLLNGDLEIADPENPDCPESWECLSTSGQFPTRITTDSFSGSASVSLAVVNDDSGAPNTASFKHSLGNVTGGETYTFSFRAKQISSGVSYVQGYKLLWFNGLAGTGSQVGTEVGPNNFTGGSGTWTENTASNLTAPSGAVSVVIEFFCATGAIPGANANGEVLIDAVSLTVGVVSVPTNLEATTTTGIGVFMLTQSGKLYKAQASDDLFVFEDLSGVFAGNGELVGAGITGTTSGQPSRFFRFLEVPAEEN
jgi:hypothetical protein